MKQYLKNFSPRQILKQIKESDDVSGEDENNPYSFSNNSDFDYFDFFNCTKCKFSACTRNEEPIDIMDSEKLALKGRECWGKLALDCASNREGKIPKIIFDWIWPKGQTGHCSKFKKWTEKDQKRVSDKKIPKRIKNFAVEYLQKMINKHTGKKQKGYQKQLSKLVKKQLV